jgi:hypothetical protein
MMAMPPTTPPAMAPALVDGSGVGLIVGEVVTGVEVMNLEVVDPGFGIGVVNVMSDDDW